MRTAGKLVDIVGSAICAIFAGLFLASAYYLFLIVDDVKPLFGVAPLYGVAGQTYSIAVLALIFFALPDPSKRTRDMSGWGAISSVGLALGALYAGLTLTYFGDSGTTVNEYRVAHPRKFSEEYSADDAADELAGGGRTRYTREGYAIAFIPASIACLTGSLLLWPIRERLRTPHAEAVAYRRASKSSACSSEEGGYVPDPRKFSDEIIDEISDEDDECGS